MSSIKTNKPKNIKSLQKYPNDGEIFIVGDSPESLTMVTCIDVKDWQ